MTKPKKSNELKRKRKRRNEDEEEESDNAGTSAAAAVADSMVSFDLSNINMEESTTIGDETDVNLDETTATPS